MTWHKMSLLEVTAIVQQPCLLPIPPVPEPLEPRVWGLQTEISLSWDPSSDNVAVTGYRIYQNGVSVPPVSTTTSTVIGGLTTGRHYRFYVTAVDAAGNESDPSNQIDPTPLDSTPPTTPQNLRQTSVTATEVQFAWDPSTDNVRVIFYEVMRDGVVLRVTPYTYFVDASRTPNTLYRYRVRAYDAALNVSPNSEELPVQTLANNLSVGLVAYYPFNGDANDESGNGNNATVSGATLTTDPAGNDNQAYAFNGSSGYISAPDNPSQQITTNMMSVAAWIRLNSDVGITQWRIVNKQQSVNRAWGLEIFGAGYSGTNGQSATGNNVVFHDSNGSTYITCIATEVDLTPQVWYQVAVTDDHGTIGIYINGELVRTCSNGVGIQASIESPIVIGRTSSENSFYFNGAIDEVRIYNRALFQEEIQAIYDETMGSIFFQDDFNDTLIDQTKWNTDVATSSYRWCRTTQADVTLGEWIDVSLQACHGYYQQPPYGSITLSQGAISLRNGAARVFPYIWTRQSPFPSTGDFALEVRMKYDSIAGYGDGMYVAQPVSTDPVGVNGVFEPVVLTIWAGTEIGLQARIEDNQPVNIASPTTFHVYRLEYLGGQYSLFVDGSLVIGPVNSSLRPNTIWIGNPIFALGGVGDWTDFTIDYVRVTSAGVE